MEKQHLKRLGYGFSALVMALSAVSFVPGYNASAAGACGVSISGTDLTSVAAGATVCLNGGITLTEAWTISQNVTIDLNGKTIEQTGEAAVFNVAAGVTLTITGKGSVTGGTGIKTGDGTVVIEGGTYDFDPTTLKAAEKAVYELDDGTYLVEDELTVDVNTDAVAEAGEQVEVATFNIVADNDGDVVALPELTVYKDGVEQDALTAATMYSIDTTGEEGVVYAVTSGAGVYTYDFDAESMDVTAFVVSAETMDGNIYDMKMGDEPISLAEDWAASVSPEDLTVVSDVEDDTVATIDADLKVSAVAPGTTTIALGVEGTDVEFTVTVNVYDSAAVTEYLPAGMEDIDADALGDNWVSVSSSDDDVVSAELDELTGEVTLTTGEVGTATLTFENLDGTITKEVTIYTYKIAGSYNFEASVSAEPVSETDEAIIEMPEGANWTITINTDMDEDGNEDDASHVGYSNGYFTAGTAGSRVFGYAITDDDNDDAPVVYAPVTFYVSDSTQATEIADQYVAFGTELNLVAKYTTHANPDSVVTYTLTEEDENVVLEDGIFMALTPGVRTVEVAEYTVDGEVITSQEVDVHVYGMITEPMILLAGEEPKEVEFDSYLSKVVDWVPTSTAHLTIEQTGDASFKISADEPGIYGVHLTAEEQISENEADVEEAEYGFGVTVFEKMAVEVEDDEIDINADLDEEDTASFTVTIDDEGTNEFTSVLLDMDEEAEAALDVDFDEETGEYTVTAMAGAEAGKTYTITLTQILNPVDPEEEPVVLATEDVEISVIDSSIEYALDVTTPAEKTLEVKTGETVDFAGTATGTLVIVAADATDEEDEGELVDYTVTDEETGAFTAEYTFEEAGTYTVTFMLVDAGAEDVEPVVYTVTVTDEEEPIEEGELTGESKADLEKALEAIAAAAKKFDDAIEADDPEAAKAAWAEYCELVEKYFDAEYDEEGNMVADAGEVYLAVAGALALGEDINVELVKKELSEDEVDAEAYAAIRQAVLDKYGDVSMLDGMMYYDIDVVVTDADGEYIGTMHEIDNAKTIVIENLAGAANGYTREYIVVRYHDGEAQIIGSSYDAEAGTVTFASDKFSTYALAYRDTLTAVADTGAATSEGASASTSAVASVVALASIIALIGAVKFAKARK